MSISRMLTRMCAVAALRGTTWADDRVFDSDNTPLSQALALNAAAKPYIVVYTDSDNRLDIDSTDLYGVRRELNLCLEIGVASKVEGEAGGVQLKTPLTDEGMEIALDMVEDQAIAALFGNPQSDWAELLKGFVMRVNRVSGQRGASADRDRRWAARQLSVICDVIGDLPPGVPAGPDHPIRLFVETSKNHPEAGMEHIAEICKALLSSKAAPNWEQIQATYGGRRLAMRAIGLAPISSEMVPMATEYGDDLTDKDGEAPILRKITHDDMQMEKDESTGLIDEFSIETNVIKTKVKDKKDKVEMGDGT
jgi:hypothetical protein